MTGEFKRIALIPAYKPSAVLKEITAELKERGFEIVVINDGSGSEYSGVFAEIRDRCTVLSHADNFGKGAALKTGLCHIMNNWHEPYVVVTLDADGQHSIDDAVRVCEAAEKDEDALIMGCRRMNGDAPLRSRLGNGITRAVFSLTSGKRLSDTQTGLRAFSHKHLHRMTDIGGERYEYEMNVIMEYAKTDTPIREIPIETIYIDGNSSSHFDTVKDSYRIYKEILKFSASSFLCFCIDYVMFCLLSLLSGSVVFSNIAARVVSGAVNFGINRKMVFKSDTPVKSSAVKYFLLALFILVCNTAMLTALTEYAGISMYAAKIMTEMTMFVLSWAVQRTAVFSDRAKGFFGRKVKGEGVLK